MQKRTRIKVCGITNLKNAQDIISLGVDGLGFIFVKDSPRYIEPELARDIISELPPLVSTVGVFMNDDPDLINDIVQYCGLSLAQLHGSEPPEYCQTILCEVIKAFRVKEDLADPFPPYHDVVKGVLLDTYRADKAGGTGECFDWNAVDSFSLTRPLFLAGGLSPDNVYEAIHSVNPFAVDVNSGVEFEPGQKSIELVKEFVSQVKRADAEK